MKTRKSISKDEEVKDILESSHKEVSDNNKKDNLPIVRKLRSRVITSDTEDDSHFKSKTPKSQRKAVKVNDESSPLDSNEDNKSSTKLTTRTPRPNKRFSAVNLFKIVEEKEEVNAEECKGKVKEETDTENVFDKESIYNNTIASNETVLEITKPTNGVVKKEESKPGGTEENSSDLENNTTVIKDEAIMKKEIAEEDLEKKSLTVDYSMESDVDSDSDDNMPESVSFTSAQNTIFSELSEIAKAVKREKEKRKDHVRKRIEMFRTQKAEKEKKRMQKMKFSEISVPERLPEDVISSLPDRPGIPTVRKSESVDKKRKREEAEEKTEHKVEEKKNKIMKFDDYIPITNVSGATQFGVVPLEVASRLPKLSSRSAAEFKYEALFGSRIKREPSKNLLIYRQKLAAAGKLQKGYLSSSSLKI